MHNPRRIIITLSLLIGAVFVLFTIQVMTIRALMRVSVEHELLLSELFTSRGYEIQKNGSAVLGAMSQEDKDVRRKILVDFLSRYSSPLVPYADTIIEVSDREGIHYGLLPAIAMVESGLCKKIPENSYNCWGWGIYGTTVTRFSSYGEAIDTVARGLKRNYIAKGMVSTEEIMRNYNPSNHNGWAQSVQNFLDLF